MTDQEAEATFRAVRWADTQGEPVCPNCGTLDAYECRRKSGADRFRCSACRKDFTITSGTLTASTCIMSVASVAARFLFSSILPPMSAWSRTSWPSAGLLGFASNGLGMSPELGAYRLAKRFIFGGVCAIIPEKRS